MELNINHQVCFFELPELFLSDLVQQYYPENTLGLAVAVNQKVVPKSQWANFKLSDKDQILLITATQGG